MLVEWASDQKKIIKKGLKPLISLKTTTRGGFLEPSLRTPTSHTRERGRGEATVRRLAEKWPTVADLHGSHKPRPETERLGEREGDHETGREIEATPSTLGATMARCHWRGVSGEGRPLRPP